MRGVRSKHRHAHLAVRVPLAAVGLGATPPPVTFEGLEPAGDWWWFSPDYSEQVTIVETMSDAHPTERPCSCVPHFIEHDTVPWERYRWWEGERLVVRGESVIRTPLPAEVIAAHRARMLWLRQFSDPPPANAELCALLAPTGWCVDHVVDVGCEMVDVTYYVRWWCAEEKLRFCAALARGLGLLPGAMLVGR